jgi:oxygen-independent coproporphyrinogen-3 oxidase
VIGSQRADSPELADDAAAQVAVYVHIPFCRRICPYCDFAVTPEMGFADRYVAALRTEIGRADPFDRPVAAVALGGGTPSAIAAASLAGILESIESRFGLTTDAEISIEANPEDITPELAESLAAAGVNRMSLGVQSFDDAVLDDLGRAHSAVQAAQATRTARSAFASVNVDLIFGSPAESGASWTRSVETAIGLDVDHLSTYALTVERGTALSRAVAAGAPAPDPDIQAERWETAGALASAAGLDRYETSNHAKPGHAVAYNLITWAGGEYEAAGLGAHRHRDGRRSWNVRRLERYVERIEAGGDATSGSEAPSTWEREVERVMLGLRRVAGVVPGRVGECLLGSSAGRRLTGAGVIGMDDGRLVLLRPLLADEANRALLALEPDDC